MQHITFPISDPRIQKLGRGNRNGELYYNGSAVRLSGGFGELWADLESTHGGNEPWLALELNGALISRFMAPPGKSKLCLLRGMNPDEVKEVTLIRETQFMPGTALTVHGFELDGQLSDVRRRKLKIEVIGDSITSGEGAVGGQAELDWVSAFFSTVYAYPWKLAKLLDADVRIFSQSGFGVTCSWEGSEFGALPKYYGQEVIFSPGPHDFSAWQPDAIIVNLGTNDASAEAHCDPQTFQAGVSAFLRLLRKNNPAAHIIWATGMICKAFPDEIATAVAEFSDDNCSVVELPEQMPETLGARGHPGETCHEQAAKTLAARIRGLSL
jgi:hypothetical protein